MYAPALIAAKAPERNELAALRAEVDRLLAVKRRHLEALEALAPAPAAK